MFLSPFQLSSKQPSHPFFPLAPQPKNVRPVLLCRCTSLLHRQRTSFVPKLATDLFPAHPWAFWRRVRGANAILRGTTARPRPRMCVLAHSWATSSQCELVSALHPGRPCPFWYVEDCFLRSNAVDGMHIFKRLFVLSVIRTLHILKNCRQLELIQIL